MAATAGVGLCHDQEPRTPSKVELSSAAFPSTFLGAGLEAEQQELEPKFQYGRPALQMAT